MLGVMALSFDGEKTYDAIDGAWLTESSSNSPTYGVIHRCAVRAQAAHCGVMTSMFAEGECIAREHGMKSLRLDTHERNLPLQGLATKCGYTRCGVITLPYEGEATRCASRSRNCYSPWHAPASKSTSISHRSCNAPSAMSACTQ